MERDKTAYLRHVLHAIGRIEEYIEGVDEQAFRDRTLIQDGVIRQLEIVGEAVKRLPITLREKHPHIPWQDIAGTRDKLIHHYFGVKIETVWQVVVEHLPRLGERVRKLLGA